jgi:hypothetical protein
MALPADWAWVKELIDEEGRTLTIEVPGAVSDANKPWRGNAAGTPEQTKGIFVRYKAKEVDGDHIKRGDQKVLCYPSDTINIERGTKIVDSLDSSGWTVQNIDKISVKSDIILYILQVRQ